VVRGWRGGWLVLVVSLVVVGSAPFAASAETAVPSAAASAPEARPPRAGRLSPRLAEVAAAQDHSTNAVAAAAELPETGPGALVWDRNGGVTVEVLLDEASPARLAALQRAGATVTATVEGSPRVTVAIDPSALANLSTLPGVRYVEEVLAPTSSAVCPTGVADEGDVQMNAGTARLASNVIGSGVKVGILSDSFNSLGGHATDAATADLPGVANPCLFNNTTSVLLDASGHDEGRAMAQIVHDLAPGAPLAFETAQGGPQAFANNIRSLQANGSKVIVDDVGYFEEPMYQDGEIAKAIRDVTALGTTYFSAAGNANVIVGGKNVSSYEAPSFRGTTCPLAVQALGYIVDCHDFNPLAGTDNGDSLTLLNSGHVLMSFGWNEPQLGISTDFDAYLINDAGQIVAGSGFDNASSQKAFEFISYTNNTGVTQNYRVVIGRYSGAAPRLKFIIHYARGSACPNFDCLAAAEYNTSANGDIVGPTIFGHSAVIGMGSIGAVKYSDNSQPEYFSSRGPATYCWGPVTGSFAALPLTPCQTKTIDVLATDGSQNSFFGSSTGFGTYRFFGTSAAAPHAAAVAALQLQAQPCRTPAEVLAAQRASAVPIGGFGVDAQGSGIVNAVGAINALAPCLPTHHFQVVAPPSSTAGQATSFTVNAVDINNKKVTNYSGTVHFTSSDGAATLPINTTLNLGTATLPATLVTAGSRTITATDTISASITGTSGAIDVGAPRGYHPLPSPVRILETRASVGAVQYNTPWGQGTDRNVHVVSNGVPLSAKAVVLNVAVVDGTLPSDLRIYPSGKPRPNASNLNFRAGQVLANSAIVAVGDNGDIQIYNNSGTVHVIADLIGWVDDGTGGGDRYVPMSTPARILESRAAVGAIQYNTRWGQETDRNVHVRGNGVPEVPAFATAVVLNVTAVDPSLPSDLRIYPSGSPRPGTSNINFAAGQNVPNLVIARIGTNGDIQIYNNSGTVDVVADVVGYYQPAAQGGNGYHPMTPTRILETRPAVGALQYGSPWGQAVQRTVHVTGGQVPLGATAVVLNVAAVDPSLPSDLRIWPTPQSRPNTSSLNFAAGQTISNLVVARVGTNGNIEIYNNSGTVDVVADIVGYYT
jgi:hypothetical protein